MSLLAAVAIGLGLLVLVGGVGLVAIRAMRSHPAGAAAPSAVAALPSAVVAAPSVNASPEVPPVPPLEEPSPDAGEAAGPANIPVGGALLAHESEANAAIPISVRRPIAGVASADVTISLFGDLMCPHTLRTLDRLRSFRERHAFALRLVFYQRPLGSNPVAASRARSLALATLRDGAAAGWKLLERAEVAFEPRTRSERIASAVERRAVDELLDADERVAALLDVRVTPTLFVNGTRLLGEPPDDLLESLLQREQRAVRWLEAQAIPPERVYALRVQRNLIDVEDGAPDRACVPTAGSPSLGPREALVTLVEFSGFECDACRDTDAAIRGVLARHPREVRRVFKGLAPREPERARRVAAFALSAQSALGDAAFWSLHGALRAAPAGLDDAALLSIASGLGLDGKRLLQLAGEELNERRLTRELELAEALDVRTNPTLFVNGRLLERELDAERLERVVVEEIAVARRIARAGTPPSRFEELSCRAAVRAD